MSETRTQMVWGQGRPSAPLMFIEGPPGESEDREGRPFAGSAERMVAWMLDQCRASILDVYTASTLMCRPTMEGRVGIENRPPLREEAANCFPRLLEEIALVDPIALCLFGEEAIRALVRKKGSLEKMVGRVEPVAFLVDGVEIVYPAFLFFSTSYYLRVDPGRAPTGQTRQATDFLRQAFRYTDYIAALRKPDTDLFRPNVWERGEDCTHRGEL